MKRFIVALLISLVLVAAYSIVAFVINVAVFGNTLFGRMPSFLARPLSLPRAVYLIMAPNFIQNAAVATPIGVMAEEIVFFFVNVLIYSIPIYGLLSIFWRRRQP